MKWISSNQILFITAIYLVSCAESNSTTTGDSLSTLSNQKAQLNINLIDAPNDEIKEVHVHIKRLEVLLSKNDKQANLVLSEDLGDVDLLKLQNGNSLPLSNLNLPNGIEIKEMRMILDDTKNFIIKSDDSLCNLKTPSAQQSGLKIKFDSVVKLEAGFRYSMTIDFDAKKSIVLTGNHGCLLKPVLRLPEFIKENPDLEETSEAVIENPEQEIIIDPPADSSTSSEASTQPQDPITTIDPGQIDAYFGIEF